MLSLPFVWYIANIIFLLEASPVLGSSNLRAPGGKTLEEKEDINGSQEIHRPRHRVLARGPRGVPTVVEGKLGKLEIDGKRANDE
jgi:hypothetical protein